MNSLVRGTTCYKIVKMLYEAGARSALRIAVNCSDFYGVDMPTKEKLLAYQKIIRDGKH